MSEKLRYGSSLYSHIFSLQTAGEKLNGVQLSPSNQQEMKNNVEKVLQFVASKKIRMHQTSAKGQCLVTSGMGPRSFT